MSTKHAKAAAGFLENKKQAAWYDETLWLVRAKRDKQSRRCLSGRNCAKWHVKPNCTATVIWMNCW